MDEHDPATRNRLGRRTTLQLAGGGLLLALAGCAAPRRRPLTSRVPAAAFLVGVDGVVAFEPWSTEPGENWNTDGQQ